MNKDKLEQFSKILNVLKEDTVSSKQLAVLLAPIIGTVKKAVSDTKAVADTSQKGLATAQKMYKDGLDDLKQQIDAVSSNLSSQGRLTLKKALDALGRIQNIQVRDGVDGRDGRDGKDGKDGTPDTAQDILAKLHELPFDTDDFKLDARHLKNLPNNKFNFWGGGGGPRNITVYNNGTIITKILRYIQFNGSGVTVTETAGIVNVAITGNGGSASLTLLSSSGTIDDANTVFPFVAQPILVVVNGYAYREQFGWSWDGSNANLSNVVGVGGDIYAITAGAQIYTTTGTINNSNTTFPFVVQPQLVVVNGNVYRQQKGWTWDGANVILNNPVGSGGDIFGLVIITPVQLTNSTIDNFNLTFSFASQPTLVVPNGLAYRTAHGWTGDVTLNEAVGVGGDIFAL